MSNDKEKIIPDGSIESTFKELQEWEMNPLNSEGIDSRWTEPLAEWMFEVYQASFNMIMGELLNNHSTENIAKYLSFVGYSRLNPDKGYIPGFRPPSSVRSMLNELIDIKIIEFEGPEEVQSRFLMEDAQKAVDHLADGRTWSKEGNDTRTADAEERRKFMIPKAKEFREKHPQQSKNWIAGRLNKQYPGFTKDWISRLVPPKR